MRDVFKRRWGVTFITGQGAYHSFEDLDLLPAAQPDFGTPKLKSTLVSVPGSNGRLDLSRALTGYMTYDIRSPTLRYYLRGSEAARHAKLSRLRNILHGQEVKIIPDEAPNGYWTGLLEVNAPQQQIGAWIVTVGGSLDPYKRDTTTTAEDWLWDPFCFIDGVIREYGSIAVSGTKTVTVVSSPAGGSPVFTASASMTMTYGGKTYNLSAGENSFDDIELPHAETEAAFTFTGTGTVSIDFRGGYL